MRWPWMRRPPMPTDEAEHAQAEARRALADAKNFDKRVEHVTGRTRQIGLRNHFAEAVEAVISGSTTTPRRAAE